MTIPQLKFVACGSVPVHWPVYSGNTPSRPAATTEAAVWEKTTKLVVGVSKMKISEPVKEDMMEVAKSSQKLGSSGKAERGAKKTRGKGGKLVQGEENVQGGGERGSVPEVD